MVRRVPANLPTQTRDTAKPVVDISKQSTGRNNRPLNCCLSIVTAGLGLALILVCGVAAVYEQFPWQASLHQTLPVHSPICGTWQADTVQRVNDGGLKAAAVVSPTEIWAVGSKDAFGGYSALIMRWDGKTWRAVDAPSPRSTGDVSLNGIAAIAANDVWTVGDVYNGDAYPFSRTLIEHWNGAQWSVVPSPNPGNYFNNLNGIVAIAPDNLWAVGRYKLRPGDFSRALILHWDGRSWVHIANLPRADNAELRAVTALGPDNIWAVGSYGETATDNMRTLVMHWDGALWNVVPSPSLGRSYQSFNMLWGVSAISPNDVWAVGSYSDDTHYGKNQTAVLHWDGAKWSLVPGPRPQELGRFHAIVSVTQNEVLAVGDAHNDDRPVNALVARFTQFPCAPPSSTTDTSTGDP